jgi:hypothetical protein
MIKFRLYREYGALNSPPIFDAVEQGIKNIGHSVDNQNPDVNVIWSVLWNGRMKMNKVVYEKSLQQKKPVLIIEVGNLSRGETWRISLDHIQNQGFFGNTEDLDELRPKKLGICLSPEKLNRKKQILIACQHQLSHQWHGMPPMNAWVERKILEIRKYTDRPIIVRPHPRSFFTLSNKNARIEYPKKVVNTYDSFDIDYDYHCVVNHSSGPPVQAAINGVPVITSPQSLAYPISDQIENIENPVLKDRSHWFLQLCHTEWTLEELRQGIPFKRLEREILNRISG